MAQGEEGGFALFAGGASNIVSSAFYLVQLLLPYLLLFSFQSSSSHILHLIEVGTVRDKPLHPPHFS